MMRRVVIGAAAALAVSGLAACGSSGAGSGGAGSSGGSSPSAATASCTYAGIQSELFQKGALTVATDKPVYAPWFEGNNPSNGKGYESAVAYAVAKQLGFKASQVHWAYEPFNDSYAPGPKKFDFDINEISYTAARAQAVSFSDSYYDVQQALVALKGSAITKKHTPADLKTYEYGDQIGTTSLQFITSQIQPSKQPKVYQTLNVVKDVLTNHQIDAFVMDTPTAQYIAGYQVPGAVMVAQFPATGEHYGLLFDKGNPLVGCVNKALSTLRSNGTLAQLHKKYLQVYLTVPTIQP
jgi:polar amino acid transport system substrate-binding protein